MPIAKPKDNLPLCDYLVQRRRFMKIKLSDLAEKTGIPHKYLKRIESGDWPALPSGVYARGFLRKYAQAVGLDDTEVILKYEREFENLDNDAWPGSLIAAAKNARSARSFIGFKWVWGNFLRRGMVLRKLLVTAVIITVSAYIIWQFLIVLEKPSLALDYPKEDNITVAQSELELRGQVTPGSILTINRETVYANEAGAFSQKIELLPGLNVLEIKASSRFGKGTEIIRRVTYTP